MGFCLGKWMESAMSAVCHDWSWYGASGNALKDYFGLELDYSVLCMSIMVQFIFFFSLIPGKLDFMTAQFLSSTFEERSLRRRWLHISHYKKKTENWGEKTCLKKKKETDELMTTLSKNDPISEQVILNDHILQKCSFMNKVWIKEL